MPKKHTIKLSIPQPCTEDWDKMTPNEKGRHCDSCNKTVVDFSLFTDRQLIEFFEKAKGLVCGRATNYQLQRQLVYTEPQNHFLYKLLFGTAIAVGFAASANAAYNPKQTSLIEQYVGNKEKEPLGGGGKDSIRVKVVDSLNGASMAFATVELLYNDKMVTGAYTDTSGYVSLSGLKQYDFDKLSLTVIYAGYSQYNTRQLSQDMQIKMNIDPKDTGRKEIYVVMGKAVVVVDPNNYITVNLNEYKSGKPLNNVPINLMWNNSIVSTANTDSLGNAKLTYGYDYKDLNLSVHVAAKGYQAVDKEITLTQEENIAIKLKPVKK